MNEEKKTKAEFNPQQMEAMVSADSMLSMRMATLRDLGMSKGQALKRMYASCVEGTEKGAADYQKLSSSFAGAGTQTVSSDPEREIESRIAKPKGSK